MKKLLLSLLMVILCFDFAFAKQKISSEMYAKTSFLSYMQREQFRSKDIIHCTIKTQLSKDELQKKGYKVQSKITDYATILIEQDKFQTLFHDSAIEKVLLLSKDEPLLDESTAAHMNGSVYAGCDADFLQSIGLDGNGVIVGILDYYPLNWKHEDFYTTSWSASDLRVLSIWDQRVDTGPNPDGFDYGTEYTKADLMSDNGPAITSGNHGTQCAGIAAGDGSASGVGNPRMGMAPEAEIIYVRKIGYSEDTIDALTYFAEKASEYGKPIVVSFSGGSKYGITDGSDPSSVALADFGTEGSIAVIAAGNYYSTTKHAQSTTTYGSPTTDITYQIASYTNSGTEQFDDFLDTIFYYRNGDDFDISITDPDNNIYSHSIGEEDAYFDTDFGRLYVIRSDYPSIEVVITDEIGTVSIGDTWTIALSCPNAAYDDLGGIWSAWMYESNITANFTNYGTGENTLNVYASGENSLSVAAHSKTYGSLYSGSSGGFTIDGRIKPDVSAPNNAYTTDNVSSTSYTVLGGTSGAAPHAAGLAALLFQLYPDYSPSELLQLFHNGTWSDSNTNLYGALPNFRYGYGKMNAPEVYTKTASASIENNVDTNNVPYSFTDTEIEIEFEGLSGSETIVVSKFEQAPWNNDIVANYISNYRWVITGEGFTSATITFDTTQLSGVTNPATIDVYKRSTEGNGSFGLPLAKSVVGTDIIVTVTEFSEFVFASGDNPLPVTLAYFTASYSEEAGHLQWQTQSETDNAGWNLYRSIESNHFDSAQKINYSGLIPAIGNSASPQNYQFIDDSFPQTNCDYFYWLESISYAGESVVFNPISLFVGEDNEQNIPDISFYGLQQNYPNPFNPETKIAFSLPYDTVGKLNVYNLKGERVKTLFSGEIEKDKLYEFLWDGKDENQKAGASGIYFFRLSAHGNQIHIKKGILLK